MIKSTIVTSTNDNAARFERHGHAAEPAREVCLQHMGQKPKMSA
jgi:hypothetical protein